MALQRHLVKVDAEATKRKDHYAAVKVQMEQQKKRADKARLEDRNLHLKNLKMQEQMFLNR